MRTRLLPPALLAALLAAPARAADDGRVAPPVEVDPAVPVPRVVGVFPDGSLDLWLAALGRPEVDVRVRAAATIGSARDRGMPGLEAAVGPLTAAVDEPGQHPAVRLAAARALVALDAKGSAAALLRHAPGEAGDYREVVEPALARWGYEPARAGWLARLARRPLDRGTILAARGLAAARDERAAPALREIALSPVAGPAVRVEAARALGVVRPAGLEADAGRLAAEGTVAGRLAAVGLLTRHTGPAAVELLRRLAADPEPAVAAGAAARLLDLGPGHVLAVIGPVLDSRGAEVRAVGVAALARDPSPDRLKPLAGRLADAHPGVREAARRGLAGLAARPEYRDPVVALGVAALAGSDWRAQEQAALLLAHLGHRPAAGRLVELLGSPRGEVFAAAGYGLRVLAVPDTLPAVTEHVGRRHQAILAGGPSAGLPGVHRDFLDRELSELVQLLGRADHRPAIPTLRRLVARLLRPGAPPSTTPLGTPVRVAAVWALGRMHAGDPDPEVTAQIEERLTGDLQVGFDDPTIRRAAAVALGRMKATGSLEVLRLYADGGGPTPDPVAHACRWAVAHMEGKPLAPPETAVEVQKDAFLLPVK